ncbi:unnamed protein product [Musa hybrid cultivar]
MKLVGRQSPLLESSLPSLLIVPLAPHAVVVLRSSKDVGVLQEVPRLCFQQPNNCVVKCTLQVQSQAVAASSPSPTKRCLAMCSSWRTPWSIKSSTSRCAVSTSYSTPYKEGPNAPGSAAGAVSLPYMGAWGRGARPCCWI